jgi:type IV pilus assembly protein PilQ
MRRIWSAALCLVLAAVTPARESGALVSLDVRDAPVADVIALLAKESGANIVADRSVQRQRVTLRLSDVPFETALHILANAQGLQVQDSGGIFVIGSGQPQRQAVILHLSHASPADVGKEITAALPAGSSAVADEQSNDVIVTGDENAIAEARRIATELDAAASSAANGTTLYRLRFTNAEDVVKELRSLMPSGVFVADDSENAVLVTGGEEDQAAAQRAIAEIDTAQPEVLFEVRVADITPLNDSSDVGLEFGGLDLQGNPLTGAMTYAFAGKSLAVNVRLNALVSNGHAQILATPRLVTLNGKEADLLIGQTYPIVYNTSVLGGSNVQFVDIGVKLRLTPIIGPDGSVTAELHPEYSELQGFTTSGYPIIANRKIDSTLRVPDGDTIVLGGLLRDATSETVEQLPWLSQIPVIGKIFDDKQSSHERDEIVFLITPHIIKPNALPTR